MKLELLCPLHGNHNWTLLKSSRTKEEVCCARAG